MVVPAADPNPEPDPVFFLAGGPGEAATQGWATAASMFPGVHARRDIVLVDQRGTGVSNPLEVPETPDLSGLSVRQIRARLRSAEDALEGLDADPRSYASPQAADDIDDVRAALGYDRIDLYGASYGATLAQYYLREHGSHVRAVVLDGGTLLDVPIFEAIADRSRDALDSVFARCAADASCRTAFPDPAGELATAMARLARHPVETQVWDPWTHDRIVLDARTLANEIHQLLVVSDSGDVPLVIHEAAVGRYGAVAERVAETSVDPHTEATNLVMFWSIVCSEGWARFDQSRTAKVGTGSYLLRSELGVARAWALACSAMPQASLPPGDAAPVRSTVPVLLLNGAEDPQDPPSNVADAPVELPNSLVVPVPALGHTVGTRGCLPAVVAAFFDAGSVDGLDTNCVADMVPAPFAMP